MHIPMEINFSEFRSFAPTVQFITKQSFHWQDLIGSDVQFTFQDRDQLNNFYILTDHYINV